MSAPTPTKKDVAADLRSSIAQLITSAMHLGDAIYGGQALGMDSLGMARLRSSHALFQQRAKELDAIASNLDGRGVTNIPPTLELIPGGLSSPSMCAECGRIGDHSTRCPEVSE